MRSSKVVIKISLIIKQNFSAIIIKLLRKIIIILLLLLSYNYGKFGLEKIFV